jgi:hypothetical protein
LSKIIYNKNATVKAEEREKILYDRPPQKGLSAFEPLILA